MNPKPNDKVVNIGDWIYFVEKQLVSQIISWIYHSFDKQQIIITRPGLSLYQSQLKIKDKYKNLDEKSDYTKLISHLKRNNATPLSMYISEEMNSIHSFLENENYIFFSNDSVGDLIDKNLLTASVTFYDYYVKSNINEAIPSARRWRSILDKQRFFSMSMKSTISNNDEKYYGDFLRQMVKASEFSIYSR